MTSYQMHFISV